MRPIERPAQISSQQTAQLTVHHYLRAHAMLAAMVERMAGCSTGIISYARVPLVDLFILGQA